MLAVAAAERKLSHSLFSIAADLEVNCPISYFPFATMNDESRSSVLVFRVVNLAVELPGFEHSLLSATHSGLSNSSLLYCFAIALPSCYSKCCWLLKVKEMEQL